MNRFLTAAAIVLSLGAAAAPVAAETINLRQLNQQRHIDAGLRSGRLTHAEASMLRREQHNITNMKKRFKAIDGGEITPRHEAIIHAAQDRAGMHIEAKKHNRRHGHGRLLG